MVGYVEIHFVLHPIRSEFSREYSWWSDMLDEPVVVTGPFVVVDGHGSRRVLAATLVRGDVTMTEQLPNDSRDVTPCVRGLEAQLLATRVWH